MFSCYEVVFATLHKDNCNGNICLDKASINIYWPGVFLRGCVASAQFAILAVFRRKYAP
jgi:hypothetical protein